MIDHFAMAWALGLFMGIGLMKLAWERDNRHRRIAPPGHSRPAGPPQPLAADMIRYARWKDEQILRALRDDGGSPTTPKPDIVPTPQGPAMRRVYYNPSTIAECGGPCTSGGPEACDCGALWRDVPIKPQPPRGRVTDVYGRTIGYQPRPQGGTPNPPPTDP